MCLFPSHSPTDLLTMVAIRLQILRSMDIACEAEMNVSCQTKF